MKARVKSWEEIKEYLIMDSFDGQMWKSKLIGFPRYFNLDMRRFCGQVFTIPPPGFNGGYCVFEWYWHRDWLEIIDEDEEIAKVYALLLIESGEI